MKNEEMNQLTNEIQEKLGKENSGIIADYLGKIISDTKSMNSIISEKEAEIEKLKNNNELLAIANGQLLQQVGMGESDDDKKTKDDVPPKKPNMLDCFDGKGGFKK